jgi:hypothetical protein
LASSSRRAGAVGLLGEGEDFGVAHQAVDHCSGNDLIGEGFAPSADYW